MRRFMGPIFCGCFQKNHILNKFNTLYDRGMKDNFIMRHNPPLFLNNKSSDLSPSETSGG